MKYSTVVFDFNGTVIDDVDLCLELLNALQEQQHLPLTTKEEYKEIFTFPIIKYYEKAGFDFSKVPFETMSRWFIDHYQKASFDCDLYPHIRETLRGLKKEGYRVILLSASQIDNLKEQCDVFGITDLFDAILGIENIHAASKLQIAKDYFEKNHIDPEECLFIGDSTHDYEVSKSLGGDCVLVTYGHQSRHVLSSCNAPMIDDIAEVKNYL